ncbi:hypothetical protein LCGC14_0083700 [marine sediment metagenome]|uniref:Uncharacterized protein n=1 Tax=marine sediment metagenome TaxID=412755 RepID=A0A0F9VX20_9ZZZZ
MVSRHKHKATIPVRKGNPKDFNGALSLPEDGA